MSSIAEVRPVRPRHQARVAPSALALLESARQGLAAAEDESTAGARYVGAHLAALRAAAAVVAARAEPPSSRRRRPQSVWELLPKVEPGAGRVGGVLRRECREAGGRRGRPAAGGVAAGGG